MRVDRKFLNTPARYGNCTLIFGASRSAAPMRIFLQLTVFCLLTVSASIPGEGSGNWSGKYSACDGHSELLKTGHLKLGVRFSTSNPELAVECAQALDFWTTVLDMEWHEDNSRGCAIQIVDGHPDLFIPSQIARAQLPNRSGFQGWIAFNPRVSLSENEHVIAAVHELGHIFGLPHNSSASSIMFYLQVDGPLILDRADLMALAAHHKLRIDRLDQPLVVTGSRMAAADPRALAATETPEIRNYAAAHRESFGHPHKTARGRRVISPVPLAAVSERHPGVAHDAVQKGHQARHVQAEPANEWRLVRAIPAYEGDPYEFTSQDWARCCADAVVRRSGSIANRR